ncbi:MAG: hypothetical protein M0R66_02475 [Candidatus Omnitrophica bacterium]|jgi:hypothetical protein|nr:hypothetical protein [Sphaerochaeta sp.]MCK9603233.1 hypothetical protein [Candidatus Omnitrophota bacterium]
MEPDEYTKMEEWAFIPQYDEMLDECYPVVTIAGMEYATSYALKNLDPIAYRCGMLDYADSLGTEII